MIESCSKKRMLSLIAILLICSLIILLLEEYVENNEFEAARLFKVASFQSPDKAKIANTATPLLPMPHQNQSVLAGNTANPHCVDGEIGVLVQDCQACSPFEMNALSSTHCKQTGYFDQFACQKSNKTYFLPCFSRSKIRTKFHAFAIASAFSALIFGLFVKWRKGVIDQKVYTRIQNTVG